MVSLKNAGLVLAAALAVGLAVTCSIPPFNMVVYNAYTRVWPPARALKVIDLANGQLHFSIVATAIKLGVFETLYRNPVDGLTLEQLAAETGTALKGMSVLTDSLLTLDLLSIVASSSPPRYVLAPAAAAHLVRESDDYMGGLFSLFSDQQTPILFNMVESVRKGGSVMERDAETPENEFWVTFARETFELMRMPSQAMVKAMKQHTSYDTPTVFTVLDIAAGSGAYGIAVAKAFKSAHVTFLDYENVLQETKRRVEKEGVLDKAKFMPGDVVDMELPKDSFDVILAPNIWHHWPEDKIVEVMRKCRTALKKGGALVTVEMVTTTDGPYPGPTGENPGTRNFRAVMLTWSSQGDAYSKAAYERMYKRAGFTEPVTVPAGLHPGSIVIGFKTETA